MSRPRPPLSCLGLVELLRADFTGNSAQALNRLHFRMVVQSVHEESNGWVMTEAASDRDNNVEYQNVGTHTILEILDLGSRIPHLPGSSCQLVQLFSIVTEVNVRIANALRTHHMRLDGSPLPGRRMSLRWPGIKRLMVCRTGLAHVGRSVRELRSITLVGCGWICCWRRRVDITSI